ncbi:hypothetical protein SWZG_00210 [Synechococcus phage S-SKS1]|uniref:Uncharacterized protein n=1 Tax=Synechococcus phage S-SKS1 TaxID=754042 RepID=M4QPL6_9CAUD|nr:hypothetical protein SWZG_00210 [Synechococcus phage S-SKS1]AGH31716.1 hypothetical protein SWZG_00210 [Synechococcus phage S-SKS1]
MIALPNPTKILYTEHSSDNTMTATFTDYVAQKDAQNTIQLNVTKYGLMLCDALQQSHQRQYPNSGRNYSYALISGRKYHKVMQCVDGQTESVHAFIDKKTGEVYKAASIKAPAKGVRFNLLIIEEREFVLENCDWAGGYLYRNAYYQGA